MFKKVFYFFSVKLTIIGFINFEEAAKQYKEYPDPNFLRFIEGKLLNEDTSLNRNFIYKIASNDIEIKCLNRLAISLSGVNGEHAVKRRRTVTREIIEDISKFIELDAKNAKQGLYSERINTPEFQIIAHYPVHFEALRMLNNLTLENYLLSLSCSQDWGDNSGGKTGAKFIKTYDQKLVFKQLEKKEFTMLLGFIQRYFKHMWLTCGQKQPSVLSKIYGIYELYNEKKSRYLIAMENMFFGLEKGVKIYDLKGSELNRYVIKKNDEDKATLLDTNYKIDRNGEPLPIRSECYDLIEKGIKNDSEFLASLKVVDYSLLLILDEKNSKVRMGIIDYLRLYDFEKQLEHVGKKFIKGTTPTITGPDDYKKRFQRAMAKYFMEVNDSKGEEIL